MLVKQMSVFVENTTGRLADLTKILAENDIDIKASTIADTVDFGILRCIVEDPEKATRILKENGFTASITEVIAVSVEHKPGGYHKIMALLAEAHIGVDYIYSAINSDEGEAVIIMKMEDPKKAIEVLTNNGVKLFCMKDLAK
ncbi:MAG: acetolactate synthase [Bacillota bacterium]|nr:acetolactate synthase [Bacillota bacterium]